MSDSSEKSFINISISDGRYAAFAIKRVKLVKLLEDEEKWEIILKNDEVFKYKAGKIIFTVSDPSVIRKVKFLYNKHTTQITKTEICSFRNIDVLDIDYVFADVENKAICVKMKNDENVKSFDVLHFNFMS